MGETQEGVGGAVLQKEPDSRGVEEKRGQLCNVGRVVSGNPSSQTVRRDV